MQSRSRRWSWNASTRARSVTPLAWCAMTATWFSLVAEPLTINVTQAATTAPAVYRVPGSAEVEALSAFARFDGTGAATSFRPALTFYSAAGLILARVFPGDAVVAGDTADVTFASFLSSGEDTSNVPLPT